MIVHFKVVSGAFFVDPGELLTHCPGCGKPIYWDTPGGRPQPIEVEHDGLIVGCCMKVLVVRTFPLPRFVSGHALWRSPSTAS